MVDTKSFTISTKSSALQGRVIRFIGSDESIDRDGDTISIDGWEVGNYMKNPVALYGHDYFDLPVGKTVAVTLDKRARQLLFDIEFPTIEALSSNPATPSEHALKVDAIYNMAKAGILNTVSVGFRGLEYEPTSTGRAYKRQELMEISIVPVPANPNATAILRAAGAIDSVIKGVMKMTDIEEKAGRKLSAKSKAALAEIAEAMKGCHGKLAQFLEDEPVEPGEEDEKVGNPAVGEEIGADVNEQQPEKMYVIDLVEKNPTDANK